MENAKNPTTASDYYDADYFAWQKSIGDFGAWADADKFAASIRPTDTVIDFGCGGGFLLSTLNCQTRIGIEPNASAAANLKELEIKHFVSPTDALAKLGDASVDVIVSNHALEHIGSVKICRDELIEIDQLTIAVACNHSA